MGYSTRIDSDVRNPEMVWIIPNIPLLKQNRKKTGGKFLDIKYD